MTNNRGLLAKPLWKPVVLNVFLHDCISASSLSPLLVMMRLLKYSPAILKQGISQHSKEGGWQFQKSVHIKAISIYIPLTTSKINRWGGPPFFNDTLKSYIKAPFQQLMHDDTMVVIIVFIQ